MLKIIRPLNLFIIGCLMYIIRWCIVGPFLAQNKLTFYLSDLSFFVICLSTIAIAAGGYIINDYFDRNIDSINQPNKKHIGTKITPTRAISLHLILSTFGLLLGSSVAILFKIYSLILINILTIFLLWYYSLKLKRQLLIGNFTIALLAAVIPIISGIYELKQFYNDNLLKIILLFSIFSFLMTLVRELIKDAEDIIGDQKYGCITFPIKYGIPKNNLLTISIISLIILLLFKIQLFAYGIKNYVTFFYLLFLLQIPLGILAVLTLKSVEKENFKRNSSLAKIIMLFGIAYGVVFFFNF